ARLLIILALGLAVITLPSFFERLHSDEVIYWEVARNISRGLGPYTETSGGGLFVWHMPLPFYIVAPFLGLSDHIFTARVISSFFTIACAVLIFLIAAKKGARDSALVSAILFLLSFQALRFGGRYYLDQYGACFFLLSFYLAGKGRFAWAGASAALAILAREYWLGVYPFLTLYAAGLAGTGADRGRDVSKGFKNMFFFVMPVLILLAVTSAIVVFSDSSVYGHIKAYVLNGAAYKNLKATDTPGYIQRITRGWVEFTLINILIVSGFLASVKRESRILLLVIPQLVIISLVQGFVVSGGVTQYPVALLATVSPYSGAGLKRFYDLFLAPSGNRAGFLKASLAVSCAQFIAFNLISTVVTLHKNTFVWGLGYSDDRKVISILRKEARGESINGFWGAFVDDRRSWDWTDFHLDRAIETDPDWLVTYENYIDILPQKDSATPLEIYNIGPYVMIHSPQKGLLKEVVRQKHHPRWALRED
ncbi:MAG: hypothetical protein AAB307_02850, partial [Deltaproteobacteria bacterium]